MKNKSGHATAPAPKSGSGHHHSQWKLEIRPTANET